MQYDRRYIGYEKKHEAARHKISFRMWLLYLAFIALIFLFLKG